MDRREEIVTFSLAIEELALTKNCSHLEAIIVYCEQTGLEVDLAAKLVSVSLRAKLKIEAEDLNLVQRSPTKRLI
jgi:hypothetical protein